MRPARSPLSSGRKAHDKPSWVFGMSVSYPWLRWGKCIDISYHEKRGHDPVHNDAEENLFPYTTMGQNLMQRLKSYLAENGVHHDK